MLKEKKKLIVLLEDEETLANLIELHLKKRGFEVKVATDGIVGLDMILKEKPDLVLLDIILPSMNGFDILEELKAKKIVPDLPVIIVSVSGQPVEIKRAQRLGVRDYLIKVNFHPNEVVEKVMRVLGEEGPAKAEEKEELTKNKMPSGAHSIQNDGSDNTVLVVEDDSLLVGALERKFVKNGYRVFTATDAGAVRAILEKEKIDIILLDIVLPDINGLIFLKELKADKNWSRIPVVIISNLGQRDEIKQGIALGAEDYIVKAETIPGEIVEKVEAILHNVKHRKFDITK